MNLKTLSSMWWLLVYWFALAVLMTDIESTEAHSFTLLHGLTLAILFAVSVFWPYACTIGLSHVCEGAFSLSKHHHLAIGIILIGLSILLAKSFFEAEHFLFNILGAISAACVVYIYWTFSKMIVFCERQLLGNSSSEFVALVAVIYMPIGLFFLIQRIRKIATEIADTDQGLAS